jgi:hypothetical protein
MNPYPQQPGFSARITHAERCLKLLAEGNHWRTVNGDRYSVASDRQMDNCFEMGDGDAVVWELMHRAQTDAVLKLGIRKSCGRALEQWRKIFVYRGPQLELTL